MIRKAVILAAGVGSRLGDAAGGLPKPLVPVRGMSPLERHLRACAVAGVSQVFLNTHHMADQVREFVGDGSAFGVRAQFSYEPELLGTAGALHAFRQELADGPFFVIYGDNILECDLAALARAHSAAGAVATIALHHRDDVSTSGMVVLDPDGRITRFVEKPPKSEQVSNLVNAGVYVLDAAVLDRLPAGASDFGRDIFPEMLTSGCPLHGFVLDGAVLPIDTPELLEAARRNA